MSREENAAVALPGKQEFGVLCLPLPVQRQHGTNPLVAVEFGDHRIPGDEKTQKPVGEEKICQKGQKKSRRIVSSSQVFKLVNEDHSQCRFGQCGIVLLWTEHRSVPQGTEAGRHRQQAAAVAQGNRKTLHSGETFRRKELFEYLTAGDRGTPPDPAAPQKKPPQLICGQQRCSREVKNHQPARRPG